MYGAQFEMSDEAMDPDFVIPFGKAKIERAGSSRFFSLLCFDADSAQIQAISAKSIYLKFTHSTVALGILFTCKASH